jgi:hypothetical protein
MAGDSPGQINTLRPLAQQEGLRQAGLDRSEQAERVVPTMPATIAFVSGSVRQQGWQRDVALHASDAMHAPLIPSCYHERVASMRTRTEGEPLRARAERLRTSRCAPGVALV